MAEQIPFEESKLGATSRMLAAAAFRLDGSLRYAAQMVAGSEPDGHSLFIELESPTGDVSRRLAIWVDGHVPSISFGDWHTHGDCLWKTPTREAAVEAVVEVLHAIFRDEFVIIVDVGGAYDGHSSVLDLREKDALAEELTSQYSTGRVLIKSWSGKADQVVGLDDLLI